MSAELRASIDIDAPPERVWLVLTELRAYPEWNPFITRAEGRVAVGGRLSLRMEPVGGRVFTMRPIVLEADPGRRLRWLGRLGMPGVFDGEHTFSVTDREGGGVRLCQEERFTGVLVPLLTRTLKRHTLPAFQAMNEALKQRAERASTTRPG